MRPNYLSLEKKVFYIFLDHILYFAFILFFTGVSDIYAGLSIAEKV